MLDFVSKYSSSRRKEHRHQQWNVEVSQAKVQKHIDVDRWGSILQDEMFMFPSVPSKKSFLPTSNVSFCFARDRLCSFMVQPHCCHYVHHVLMEGHMMGMIELAKAAHTQDDTDLMSCVVRSAGERGVMQMMVEEMKKRTEQSMRIDGVDTSMMACWAQQQRQCKQMLQFLRDALEPCMVLPDAFELDVKKVRHEALLPGNIRNVEQVCDQVLQGFLQCQMPPLLIHLCRHLHTEDALVDCLVLRILSPAIISPDRFGVLDFSVLQSQRRALLNVAKLLQQVANNIPFEASHSLVSLNPFVVSRGEMLRKHLKTLTTMELPTLSDETDADAFGMIAMRLPIYADTIIASINANSIPSFSDTSPRARLLRLLYRFSLTRQPAFLEGADESSEDGGGGHSSGSSQTAASPSSSQPTTPTRKMSRVHSQRFPSPNKRKLSNKEKGAPLNTIEDLNNTLDDASAANVDQLVLLLNKKKIYFKRWFVTACLFAAEMNPKRAKKILLSYHAYHAKEIKQNVISIANVEAMVLDGILIVHPQLVSLTGHRIMYMRPARFFPSTMRTSDVILLLHYMTQRLVEDPQSQMQGFVFMADLNNWTMKNFSRGYALTWFLTMLVMPVKLHAFIIVDAPPWFDLVWRIIRTVMPKSFQDKWTYVKRGELDSVVKKEHRTPDLEDGTVNIDLAAWCEDRRVAEQGDMDEMNPFLDGPPSTASSPASTSHSPARPRSRKGSMSISSRNSSLPDSSGKITPLAEESYETDEDDDSSTAQVIRKAAKELMAQGADNVTYEGLPDFKGATKKMSAGNEIDDDDDDSNSAVDTALGKLESLIAGGGATVDQLMLLKHMLLRLHTRASI